MMRIGRSKFVPLVCTVTLLFSAISAWSQSEVVDLYKNERHNEQKYKSVLVIDLASEAAVRVAFENAVVGDLRSNGIQAVAGSAVMESESSIDMNALADAISRTGADAFLVTHIIGTSRAKNSPDATTTGPACECLSGSDLIQYDDLSNVQIDPLGRSRTAFVVASFYDAESMERVVTMQSECIDIVAWPEIVADQSNIIVGRLRQSWLSDEP
jgi:hypothetical protein